MSSFSRQTNPIKPCGFIYPPAGSIKHAVNVYKIKAGVVVQRRASKSRRGRRFPLEWVCLPYRGVVNHSGRHNTSSHNLPSHRSERRGLYEPRLYWTTASAVMERELHPPPSAGKSGDIRSLNYSSERRCESLEGVSSQCGPDLKCLFSSRPEHGTKSEWRGDKNRRRPCAYQTALLFWPSACREHRDKDSLRFLPTKTLVLTFSLLVHD